MIPSRNMYREVKRFGSEPKEGLPTVAPLAVSPDVFLNFELIWVAVSLQPKFRIHRTSIDLHQVHIRLRAVHLIAKVKSQFS
jgi:hypothetical protein